MAIRYIKRDIEKILKRAARQFSSIIVTGPRQSGKTTLLKHLFLKSHRYVSLDDPEARLMAKDDPRLFLDNYPAPLIIDEIQYAPELFSHIKIRIDENRARKGLFLLTGSQSFPLMAKVGESLAGRIAIFTLLSFSFKEEFRKGPVLTLESLKKRILRGGFPEITVNKNIDLKLWYAGYLQTYLERDIRNLRQIGDLTDFQRFLQLLAAFNGQVLNLSSLSRDLGVAVNTVKTWISILEASHQIILIKPFYLNKGKRIIKSPKVYFLDTGLLCYLTGLTSAEQVLKGPLSGQIFEGLVLGEIIRNFYNRGEIPRIFWWRTSYGEEVDFIIEKENKIIPVEVKMTAKAQKGMIKNLISFDSLFQKKIDKSYLINLSDRKITLERRVEALPFFKFAEGNYI